MSAHAQLYCSVTCFLPRGADLLDAGVACRSPAYWGINRLNKLQVYTTKLNTKKCIFLSKNSAKEKN